MILLIFSYGFHRNHCEEAMEYTKGNLEAALNLLYSKYMQIESKTMMDHGMLPNELLEQRKDEKGVLESIYETTFKEKVTNYVWVITFHLEYIVNLLRPAKPVRRQINHAKVKKKAVCRLFLDGNCKYGSKCRFLHEIEEPEKVSDVHLNTYAFDLEIRFPENTSYPFEPPLIFLKSSFPLPELFGLHVCKKLYEEAVLLAQDGMPSVYSIAELLKNEDVMKDYLKISEINFLLPSEKLFPIENGNRVTNKSSHFEKGVTNRGAKAELTASEIFRENRRIVQRFEAKTREEKYLQMLEARKSLPAWKLKNDIINTVESSQVTVISGETGCGKSTQVPQFLLENWLVNYESKKNHVNIVCTQPRRISAIGVAERVADERSERIGNTVGKTCKIGKKS